MALVHKLISGARFIQWLCDNGIVPETTRRVVIEADWQSVVTLYIECTGSDQLLQVEPFGVKPANVHILDRQG